jgi:putative PIN family toxin of toxin-antitoxin system
VIVVFDSGVWISALHFSGTPLEALDSAIGKSQIAMCSPILSEIHSALKVKFKWSQQTIDQTLAEYAREIVMVQISGNLNGFCRDPKDDMVLECAFLAGAEIIVSGDKDLLTMNSFRGIRILSPREFLTFQESEDSCS